MLQEDYDVESFFLSLFLYVLIYAYRFIYMCI